MLCRPPVIAIGLQSVGLNVNPGRLIVTLTCLICSGIPSRICGIAYGSELLLVIVSAAVLGLTSIFARTTRQSHAGCLAAVCSRSNGPAFAGFTIDRPNGAQNLWGPPGRVPTVQAPVPLNGPVM